MHSFTRRSFCEAGLKTGLGVSLAMAADSSLAQTAPAGQSAPSGQTAQSAAKGRIHQSVCRWCYKEMTVDQLAEAGADVGLVGVDLLEVDEWEIPHKYGLICTMGYAGGETNP